MNADLIQNPAGEDMRQMMVLNGKEELNIIFVIKLLKPKFYDDT